MSFSEKLQKLRKDKGLSQEELAEIMDVSRQAVSKWESGQSLPDVNKLIEISNYFAVSIDDLIKDENDILNSEQTEIKNVSKSNNLLDSRMKRGIYISLAVVCIVICLLGLTTIDQSFNIYQAVIRIAECATGIIASLLVGIKIMRYNHTNGL